MQTLNLDEQEMVAGGYRPFEREIFLGKIAIDPEAIRRAIGLTIRGPGAVNFNIGRSLPSLAISSLPSGYGPGTVWGDGC